MSNIPDETFRKYLYKCNVQSHSFMECDHRRKALRNAIFQTLRLTIKNHLFFSQALALLILHHAYEKFYNEFST